MPKNVEVAEEGRPDRPHREKQEGLSADYSQSERQEGNLHEGGRHWKHQQTEQPKPVVSAFAYWQENMTLESSESGIQTDQCFLRYG